MVQVDVGLEEVERRGCGEHGGVDVFAVVEEVLLYGVRAHAVADQHQRDRWVLLAGLQTQPIDVVDQRGPAVVAEAAELGDRGRGASVAAMVLRVDDVPLIVECLGEMGVSQGVLTTAVGDLHDGSRVARRVPSVGGDDEAPGAAEVHAGRLCAHALLRVHRYSRRATARGRDFRAIGLVACVNGHLHPHSDRR